MQKGSAMLSETIKADDPRPRDAVEQVPPLALVGIALLIAVSFAAAIMGRVSHWGDPAVTAAEVGASGVVAVRHLKFADLQSGGIAIYDAGADTPFETLAPGGDGFLRGTLRSLARARKLQHAGSQPPIDLVRRSDGTLSLEDKMTGRFIYLEAFGPTNSAVFERIMNQGDPKP